MNGDTCRHEVHVRRAAIEDNWSESLRDHLETCIHCRAAAAVAPAMSRIASVNERTHVLPAPAVIWLKAQLLRGNAATQRVSRPLNIMQIIAYVAVAGGWAAFVMLKWDDLLRFVLTLTPKSLTLSGNSFPLAAFTSLLLLGSITFALAMHTILAEE